MRNILIASYDQYNSMIDRNVLAALFEIPTTCQTEGERMIDLIRFREDVKDVTRIWSHVEEQAHGIVYGVYVHNENVVVILNKGIAAERALVETLVEYLYYAFSKAVSA